MNRSEAVETIGLAIVLTMIAGMILYCFLFPRVTLEPGITWEKTSENEGEDMETTCNNVFEGQVFPLKFVNLNQSHDYYLVYFTLKDTVTLASFKNVTEQYIMMRAEEQTYYLMRDDAKIVIILNIIPVLIGD